ncbi:hypothetical protein KR51_00004440 [Rubidibacter lacunae KORDI 51-2]|uniref:Uncharacterized protein n=1 Tax=Rubidibacter lacunae KORDI 51-2 TaxID=582515 RepID=U5DT12_9CHRO|nr:hypothetical protein KR51_00004440 [Rubidibacter lacunae KORDI 51-2]
MLVDLLVWMSVERSLKLQVLPRHAPNGGRETCSS